MSAPTDVCECGHIHMDGFGVIRAACPAHGCKCDKFTARGLPPESQGEPPQPAEPCAQGADGYRDQAHVTAANIRDAVNIALEANKEIKQPKFGEGMTRKIADGLRIVFANERRIAAAASAARIAELEAHIGERNSLLFAAEDERNRLTDQLSEVTRERDALRADFTKSNGGVK